MTTKRIRTIAKIKKVEYRNTSVYGNPSYYIAFEDEKGKLIIGYTKPNAACAYGARNPDLREFAYIEYHMTKSGKIVIDYICNKHIYDNNYKVTK